MPEPESKSSIQVIDRMMALLDALARHPGAVGLKQLSRDAGLHPSTTHRILATLAQSGFVERAEGGTYRLGIRLLELGNLVKSRLDIREVAAPPMQSLHEMTGESVNLGVRRGDEIVYVERSSSGRAAVRIVHIIGARAPLHTSATGKLFLAQESPQAVEDYARRTGLPAATPASITTLPALQAALDAVREQGMAFDMDEVETGVRCIAAGIYDDTGTLVAGLSLSMPAERFTLQWAEAVRTTAQAISKSLGHDDSMEAPEV